MKKSDLKQLIKPLVKECIHEVLIEEGLLANVVTEVTKGMQGALLTEVPQKSEKPLFTEDAQPSMASAKARVKLTEHRKSLME